MINSSSIREFLLGKWWSSQLENSFFPPQNLWFANWFSLYIPESLDKKSSAFEDIIWLIASVYEIDKNNLIASVWQYTDILSIRISDADNQDGGISLDVFEYFIDKTKSILLKTARFVIDNKPKLEWSDIEAKKYLWWCRFLQTNKWSFITNISLPTNEIIRQWWRFVSELRSETINQKVFDILDFVHNSFFDDSKDDLVQLNTAQIVEQNRELINVDILNDIRLLYDKSTIGNISFRLYDHSKIEVRETNPRNIGKENIDNFSWFISEIETDLRKDKIDSYWTITDLHSKDWKTDWSVRKITLETKQYLSTPVVVSISIEQYNQAIESHKKYWMVKIKWTIEKASKHINVKKIEELTFM